MQNEGGVVSGIPHNMGMSADTGDVEVLAVTFDTPSSYFDKVLKPYFALTNIASLLIKESNKGV